jgi:class 3 adenylate cyclase
VVPLRDGVAILGIYGKNAEMLYLFRVGAAENAERLLEVSCAGDSFEERVGKTAVSEFACDEGVVYFAVRTGNTLERYLCREQGGVEPNGKSTCDGGRTLSVLTTSDGAVIVGGAGYLLLNGQNLDSLVKDQALMGLTRGRGGWYYINAATLDVCFLDAGGSVSQRMFRFDTEAKGYARTLTSAALTRDERALLLLDGSVLIETDAQGSREITGLLGATRSQAIMTIVKYAAFAIAAAALLWLLLCGLRNGYASLAVFRGGALAMAALLCFALLTIFYLIPATREASLRENREVVEAVLRATRADKRINEPGLVTELSKTLEGTDAEGYRNVRVVVAQYDADTWVRTDGRRAETLSSFSPALAQEAHHKGTACSLENGVFRYVCGDESVLSIQVENAMRSDGTRLSKLVFCGFAIVVAAALLILISISGDVRRLSEEMERISQGGAGRRLNLHTGDELESMASIVNSLGISLREQEESRVSLEHSYRRFVPEKVLALLGKQSIRDVDKSTFAARRMAVMTVWFTFPEHVYTNTENSRLLFDSVNEVIERTASIVARKGGTVFHFSYDGFDVVMEEGGEVISTAVAIQQEVLSLNELRAQKRLPAVTLRIALDVGNVMLGIVGDSSQMEPTTISSSLSVVRELMGLCNRLEAGILCTEAIISEKQDYGSRYMGKCVVGSQSVRVYEVFDGDEFNIRRGKAASMRDFSQGVYDLYAGDTAGAKHMFLQLAHNYPFDGGARYYLYLADRLEHDPSLHCVLNVDGAGGKGI